MTEIDRTHVARIARLRRIFYVLGEETDRSKGPLEITFDDGGVECFDAGADGQTLRVDAKAWTDPFAEPLSAENVEYVRTYGKWAAFDVSEDDEYRAFVGQLVLRRELIEERGSRVGVLLHTRLGTLAVTTRFDELLVDVLPGE